MALQLYATPLSHFARKIRILLGELGVPFELVFVKDLLSSHPADFGGNPILRIPTLVDGEHWIVESDQIARHVVEKFDAEDHLHCLDMTVDQRNALSMINATMGAEVEILLSARSGIADIQSYSYFQRHYEVIQHCLIWLEKNGKRIWPKNEFSYLDIALICMWDHINYYQTIDNLGDFSLLKQRADMFSSRPSVQSGRQELSATHEN
ncbi:MAG: glutathione S-transferase family protein [Planctomycetes bacterium]|nr:glutathione S-transferase family protein [Planctomycetota bacterium]